MLKSYAVLLLSVAVASAADAPARKYVRTPPEGIPIPADIKSELESGVSSLGHEIDDLKKSLQSKPDLLTLLPDVQIYYNAIRYALDDNIFYSTNDFSAARKLLDEGNARARSLRDGQAPWNSATGLIVRGYKSKVDGSIQPYGLVVPPSFKVAPLAPRAATSVGYRLDFWYHGRNAKLSELSFITDREHNRGEFTPPDTFVLHPYGRFCNANKFVGEVDTFEALENVRKHYPIDENRISVRGFSMGGAATWHLAGHYASLWAAASPGAGFVDTYIFQKISRLPTQPPWYVQKLWHLYDVTDYAANLFNCPVVAYSGEIDGQREAAELMNRAMSSEGIQLVHIIGPKTAHKFEPKAKEEVARRVDALMEKGRNLHNSIRFTTWTLRYNNMGWVTVDGLEQHWTRARVDAACVGPGVIKATTTNVSALTFSITNSHNPPPNKFLVALDGQAIYAPSISTDGYWTAHFEKQKNRWKLVTEPSPEQLRKRHGLQGPIDDAFMDSFIMVRPTGKPISDQIGNWSTTAMSDAIREWRLQFRGDAPVKDDVAITDADIANNNLILWGDPRSNRLFARIAPKLPLHWDRSKFTVAGTTYSFDDHVPILIYPNPLNSKHYIVLNSGFTFADEASTSNALQIPKLPDYAVRNINTREVENAGFFDEDWQFAKYH
jgi:Prolyl oligopeptidase family